MILFIGMNIVFWNCQSLRTKRTELQNYFLENQIDILSLNETFLNLKIKFHLPGYDIYKNDRLVSTKGGVAIMVKEGIIVNQEWKNEHFNVITDNEALAIEIELQNVHKVILAIIYCPNGNPSLGLFRMINALSKQAIFLRDFNSKHKQFGCVKPNKFGQTLVNIAKDLKLFYVNQLGPNRHTRDDPVHGTSDILDMAFITPGVIKFPRLFLSALLMTTWSVITSRFKFHFTSHLNGIHHLLNHVTDLTKQIMTYNTTHWKTA